MTSAFSPDGSEPLGRTLRSDRLRQENEDIKDFYQLDSVVAFLAGFEGNVALQLGDRLLADSMKIVRFLRQKLPSCTFCIVGDSTYGDRDVDEISARHLGCGKIVFFGDFSFKTTTQTDSFFVRLDNYQFSVIEDAVRSVIEERKSENYIVVSANSKLAAKMPFKSQELNLDWTEKCTYDYVVYIGEQKDDKIVAWCMQYQPQELVVIDPNTGQTKKNPFDTGRLLMQRFHLIEKAKDAERVGLVLGSNGGHELSVACLNRLRELALASGKTPYTVVVGDPTPQKLANFPEMDIFVLVGSPEASILPARGFYKPVIHPWEFSMAATGNEWDGSYWADWEKILEGDIEIKLKEHDISLITGKVRSVKVKEVQNPETSVMIKGSTEIAEMSCHTIRRDREYFGLTDIEKEAPSVLKDGTSGIAQGYEREPSKDL